MPQQPTDAQPQSWQRFFAIECNNRAWDLASRARSPEGDLEMLNAAHAAAWHWSNVGTELNQVRAKLLLARVHTLLGHSSTALTLAADVRRYFVARETAASELAFTHAIYAHAAYIAGDSSEHRAAYAAALEAEQNITEEPEQKLFRETFDLVPAP